jgi:CRISPR-associated protein Cmr3
MTTMLEITCRDPIVSRDGRPFGAGQGNRMRSLDWLLPSVLAGSVRTTLGKSANRDFSVGTALDLLQVEVAGPFPHADGQMYFPAPQDCVVRERVALRAAPQPIGQGGCDWPAMDLQPVGLTKAQAPSDFKPEEAPAWWPEDRFAAWLAGEDIAFDDRFLRAPKIEDRTHVRLDPDAGAAEDSQLFTTAALALTHLPRHTPADGTHMSRFAAIALTVRIRAEAWCGEAAAKLDTLHPLGGERRLAHCKAAPKMGEWNCPQKVRDALAAAPRARMALTTPAIFRHGWKPGWLNDALIGTPPGANIALRLVGVSIQRWRAVSGWSLAELPGQPRGPKPVKRLVPAGGVYFFEIAEGEARHLADRWLEPVSDDEQDRRDGFGLAVWGTW